MIREVLADMVTNPAIVSAVIASVVSILGYLGSRRKVEAEIEHEEAETDSITVASALTLIEPMQQRIMKLEARLDDLERRNRSSLLRIEHLEQGVKVLQRQVIDLGSEPAFKLPNDPH